MYKFIREIVSVDKKNIGKNVIAWRQTFCRIITSHISIAKWARDGEDASAKRPEIALRWGEIGN